MSTHDALRSGLGRAFVRSRWYGPTTKRHFILFFSPSLGGSHDRRRRWDAESPTPPNTPLHPSPCGPSRGLSITPPAARRIERSAGENRTLAPASGQIEQRRAHIGAQAAARSHRGEGDWGRRGAKSRRGTHLIQLPIADRAARSPEPVIPRHWLVPGYPNSSGKRSYCEAPPSLNSCWFWLVLVASFAVPKLNQDVPVGNGCWWTVERTSGTDGRPGTVRLQSFYLCLVK